MAKHTVVVVPGDGVGVEVMAATREVLVAAGAPLELVERHMGQSALDAGEKDPLPEATMAALREHHVALKGPCSTPIGHGFRSVNVGLRQQLNLFAAVRPVRSLPGIKTRFEDVDLVIVRENTEGLYSGIENVITDGVVVSMKVATRVACQRIARWTFRYATHARKRKVTVLHKANIMKFTDGMFLAEARKVHDEDYPNIEYEEVIIDAGTMRLVRDPTPFDILLCENLYGDIVSDLCAGMVGGLGVCPGANFGEHDAVFEAVHGSAPDIAGKNLANPLALFFSATMMLEHLGTSRKDPSCTEAATRIDRACLKALEDGQKTRDLKGDLGTREFTRAVVARLA